MKKKQFKMDKLRISSFITQSSHILGGDTVLTDWGCPETEHNCGGGGGSGQLTCEKGFA